jgi:hypothetical protein
MALFRKALVWVGMGIPGALAFFSTVSVSDATTNLAGWAEFFGLKPIPAFLAAPDTDLIGFAIGLSFAGVTHWMGRRLNRQIPETVVKRPGFSGGGFV